MSELQEQEAVQRRRTERVKAVAVNIRGDIDALKRLLDSGQLSANEGQALQEMETRLASLASQHKILDAEDAPEAQPKSDARAADETDDDARSTRGARSQQAASERGSNSLQVSNSQGKSQTPSNVGSDKSHTPSSASSHKSHSGHSSHRSSSHKK